MIKIDKSQEPVPPILGAGGRGQEATDELKTAAGNGATDFPFSSRIYGHKTVKAALKKIQHKKCCFCESKVSHISHGDVEHFRPKAGFKADDGPLKKPGYYWLAYHFSNLYFACQVCNQIFKKNFFPLANEATRALSHNDDLSLEESLIVDPGNENPEDHIVFEGEVIKAKNNSVKGEATINRMGLGRDDLTEMRMHYYILLKQLAIIARTNIPELAAESADAKAKFKEFGQPKSQYSLMVRNNFPDLV